MRLICISDKILSLIKKLEVKLPSYIWNSFYAPLPNALIKNSHLKKLLQRSTANNIPSNFKLDTGYDKAEFSIIFPDKTIASQCTIKNAVLLPNGAIINNNKILSQSSNFSKFSFSDYIETCNFYFRVSRPVVENAVFFPRLINRRGTYGDYFAEFLVPFAGHNVSKQIPILFDADFTFKPATIDLPVFGFKNLIKIPENGLIVRQLHVKFPNHYFDNFLHESIDLLKKRLPVSTEIKSPSKVYISRLGYKADPDNRNSRELINEFEVENFLKAKGYFILRSHEVSNSDSRIFLSNAQIIVFNHGSGFVHAAWSSVRTVIEIGLSNWWNPYFLKLCNGMGVKNYSLLMAENGSLSINKLCAAIEHAENT